MKILRIVIFSTVMFSATLMQGQFSVQKVLIEVFTGAWSQYSPDGFVKLDTVLAHYPNAIAVNVHNSDAMEISEGADLATFYNPSYPQALINRSGTLYSKGSWATATASALMPAAYVSVTFDSVRFNPVNRTLDVYIKAMFTGSQSGDMRFNCIVVEDSVSGSGSGYNQVNGDNTTPGHPFYQAGNPMVGYKHRFVARKYLGDIWGTSGVIAASVSFGSAYWYHYSYTLPMTFNENNISLVGLVSRYDGSGMAQRKILNVNSCEQILPPAAGFSVDNDTLCLGGSITYQNTSSPLTTSWSWTFEGGNPSASTAENPGMISYSHPGNYITTLVVTGITGTSSYSKQITIDSANTTLTQTGTHLISQAANATYQWLDCNNNYAPIAGEQQQQLNITHNGNFAVEVTQRHCVDTSACVLIDDFSVQKSEKQYFLLFPNPTDRMVTLYNQENLNGNLRVFDITGRTLLSLPILQTEIKIDMQEFENGVYVFCISSSGRTAYYKIAKRD